MLFVCLIPSYTVSNDTNLVCHDFNTYWLILIIFGRSVIEKVSSETVIYSPSYLTNDSALHYLAKHENTKIISFHLNAVSLFETQCTQLLTMSAFDVFTPFCLCSLTSVVHYKVFSVILCIVDVFAILTFCTLCASIFRSLVPVTCEISNQPEFDIKNSWHITSAVTGTSLSQLSWNCDKRRQHTEIFLWHPYHVMA